MEEWSAQLSENLKSFLAANAWQAMRTESADKSIMARQ